ncbi:MAG TPA: YciI family protein [Gaiellaceae bacterium]|nr:YciI family protein [Gaiellaceae bacterium]
MLLRAGVAADGFADAELDRLQAAHLAHLDAMAVAGKLVGAGPFRDQADASLRGLCFYACDLDEARELAEQDPAVRAGRLTVEAMTWLTQKGAVAFHPEARRGR